jgi:hypothetical protein
VNRTKLTLLLVVAALIAGAAAAVVKRERRITRGRQRGGWRSGHDFLSLSDSFAALASTTLSSALRRDSSSRLAMIAAGERLF